MSTVASRTFRSSPHRNAAETWNSIIALLTRGRNEKAEGELKAVSGIAASIIADLAPKDAPIVVTCDGPRTRIYCVYDEDALTEDNANENSLGFDPLEGDWAISFPCNEDDLTWVQNALKKHSERITARDQNAGISTESASSNASEELVIDPKGFTGA